jgi:hypothetical protein
MRLFDPMTNSVAKKVRKPWRGRRASRGFNLIRSALFSKWPTWAKITGFTAVFLLLFAGLLAFMAASLENDSLEAIAGYNLRYARVAWLHDGCPQPFDAEGYLGTGWPSSNYVFAGALVMEHETNHILFAEKMPGLTDTFVITTMGDILAVDQSGHARLLKKGSGR